MGVACLVYVIVFTVVESVRSPAPDVAEPVVAGGLSRFAGVLLGSFFIHHGIIPIISTAKNQQRCTLHIWAGYTCAVVTYMIPGIVGNFSSIFVKSYEGPGGYLITQNFLNSFSREVCHQCIHLAIEMPLTQALYSAVFDAVYSALGGRVAASYSISDTLVHHPNASIRTPLR